MRKMSKKWVVLILFAVNAILIPTVCQASGDEEFKSGYGFFVKALRQFPYPYKLVGDQQLGTYQGSSGIYALEEADFKYYTERYGESAKLLKYIELRIVTRDDKLVAIKVVGDEIQLAIFWHELKPDTGKYKFWSPVILFPVFAKKLQPYDKYWVAEIDIVGRFFIKWDSRGKDPNKILGYENEMYYH